VIQGNNGCKGEPPVRVVVVEDFAVVRSAIVMVLNRSGCVEVVGKAGDGLEAIEIARQAKPDVILMDISLPKLDGVEATRRIKQEMPSVHIVGLSMFLEEAETTAIKSAGATVVRDKAAPIDALIAAIVEIASHHGDSQSVGAL